MKKTKTLMLFMSLFTMAPAVMGSTSAYIGEGRGYRAPVYQGGTLDCERSAVKTIGSQRARTTRSNDDRTVESNSTVVR